MSWMSIKLTEVYAFYALIFYANIKSWITRFKQLRAVSQPQAWITLIIEIFFSLSFFLSLSHSRCHLFTQKHINKIHKTHECHFASFILHTRQTSGKSSNFRYIPSKCQYFPYYYSWNGDRDFGHLIDIHFRKIDLEIKCHLVECFLWISKIFVITTFAEGNLQVKKKPFIWFLCVG